MEKMNFEQMEVIHGGGCFKEGAIVFASAVGMLASATGTFGVGTGIGLVLLGWSYADYLKCKVGQMGDEIAIDEFSASYGYEAFVE